MPRIDRHGHDRINKVCESLKRLAGRVYKDDLGRLNGCNTTIKEMEVLIMRGDYDEANYNPYQELANRLKKSYPEVWTGDEHASGIRLLEPWHVS